MAKQLELELVVVWGPGAHLMVRTWLGWWQLHLGTDTWWAELRGCPPWGGGPDQPSSSYSVALTPARNLGGPGLSWPLSFLSWR